MTKKVFTNGCFDILHIGHVRLLEYCKQFGNVVVGLNSDLSVTNLKGSERPINNVNDRKEFLLALRFVDEVVIFEEKTPLKLIKKIKPDIIVKGGDYRIEEIIGSREVLNYGGEVKIFPFVAEKSSTSIIKFLKK